MDYFRGIVAIQERSDRVLTLTGHIIHMNPAHYSIWSVRRFRSRWNLPNLPAQAISLRHPTGPLFPCLSPARIRLDGRAFPQKPEILPSLVSPQVAPAAPHHAPLSHGDALSAIPPTPVQELSYLTRVLAEDVKNYHTWAYRQWVLTYYGDTHPDLWEHDARDRSPPQG